MTSKKRTILVTGGAGYIGSHIVSALRSSGGYRIEIVDNFRESRSNVIQDESIVYHEVDIRNKEKLMEVFELTKPDLVFHFAALASVPDSMENPAEYYENNVVGGLNLLECMRVCGVKKIVFSSSASTYGEPLTEEITEEHPQVPTNTYGYTKLIFENMLKDYNRSYGFSSISLRYFCASGCDVSAGIGEYHTPETHAIPSIVETLLGRRKEFSVYGNDFPTPDGTGVRDYIHVMDLAEAHTLAMNKLFEENLMCKQYNLGINKGFSVMELIKSAEEISGKKLSYSIKDRRLGDPSRLIANSDKAQKELGWTPKHLDVKDMIASTYEFFSSKK
ncbi:MAG: UDP-glucose 4-epimerase [Patescibacteria group bacterium]|nr:UDP-glucose 4-epimerase [Patescibacteria group bacterium]